MKKQLAAVLAGAALMMAAGTASATVVNQFGGGDGSELNMQQILNSVTEDGTSSVDAFNDFLNYDSYWTTGGTGISSATMIIEIAGFANINNFGIYDSLNPANYAQLFSGTAIAGDKVAFTFGNYVGGNLAVVNMTTLTSTIYYFNSQTFGFYLNSGNNTFHSDDSLNTDNNFDHMVAYNGTGDSVKLPGAPTYTPWLSNEYVLGFEDTFGGGDYDYNDLVLMVESVAPVPEPGTFALLGAGILGLALYRRKAQK